MNFPPSPKRAQIAKGRAAAGLTHAQAGAIVYVSERAWQDYESGKRNMPADRWEYWQLLIANPTLRYLVLAA